MAGGAGEKRSIGDDPLTLEALILCPSCGANFPPSSENFKEYFKSKGDLRCPSCTTELDWWELILDAIRTGFLGYQYAAVRAQSTVAQIDMTPEEPVEIDLTALGLPATARVLDLNYTPGEKRPESTDGLLMPLEMHSNTPNREVRVDRPLVLYPRPIGESPPELQKLTLMVVWIDQASLSVAEGLLLASIQALNGGRHQEAVVPAATAIEVSLAPIVSSFFEGFAEAGPVGELLRRTGLATQMDALLPAICGVLGAPQLPDKPQRAARELRKLRNKAAHDGQLPAGVSRGKVATAVAGAVFAVEFALIVNEYIVGYHELR